MKKTHILLCFIACLSMRAFAQQPGRSTLNFDQNWSFNLGDVDQGQNANLDDSKWPKLNLPHDWSIEGEFSKDNPATPSGGALPGGIGWYRKTFEVPASSKGKQV